MWKKIHLQIYGVMERSDFLIHEVFLILRLTRLFWYSKKVLFRMNTWIIENYKHTKRVWKKFEIKNLSGYHDFYVQNNTLLLADVFESFQTKCIGTYIVLILFIFFQHQNYPKVELELLIDIDMLLMIKKGQRRIMSYYSSICRS